MERSNEARRLNNLYDRLSQVRQENRKLKAVIKKFINIKQCADGGTSLVSNQGQGMDGYSELANYRKVIEQFMKGNN